MLGDERGLPPVLQATRSGFADLPGTADPVDAIRYVCPVDRAYADWPLFVGDPIPCCPDVGLPEEDWDWAPTGSSILAAPARGSGFQVLPGAETVKHRLHLDICAGSG